MGNNKVSRTAILTAIYRAYHSRYDNEKVFDDYMAYQLLREDEYKSFVEQMVNAMKSYDPKFAASFPDDLSIISFMMQSMAVTSLVLSRAAYAEEYLEKMINQGVKQHVVLGAGMDTFAFRHPELLKKIKVFEIDHPATQKYKLQRLTELNWKIPENLHFIPIDFTKESLVKTLKRSPYYEPHSLSVFSWLGVTYYLPRETVLAILRSIAEVSTNGSSIIFDYFDLNAFNQQKAAQRVQVLLGLAKREEEPMITGFNPETLLLELTKIGLKLSENMNPIEIQKRYFEERKDKYYACEHAHFANAVVQ
ncbi:SAM-dependent methyltransferase [Heliobacillus mobilis]|uniref:S-adenosyl-L-methionine-dependent methyltransferase n=1 Tax=Heliobacterium mobile TaxID=28064 RepID=A0A6I3SM61_HELMO|nr:class I SAM-dependent methyltransferase [Heliobacterium mobile]MTV50068.1 SAM-dependent methyltransferase [Heliobacterium mobile]